MSLLMSETKSGDIVSFTYYCAVEKVGREELAVKDLERSNNLFLVKGKALAETGHSADQFSKTVACTKTELAARFVDVGSLPFTVSFTKANGEKRVLRGKYLNREKLLGRSQVIDFDISKGNPMRLVCHRTLLWLIVNNVKYILKK